jgi:hypothetical protein
MNRGNKGPKRAVAKGVFPSSRLIFQRSLSNRRNQPIFNGLEKLKAEKTNLATLPGIETCFGIFRESSKTHGNISSIDK